MFRDTVKNLKAFQLRETDIVVDLGAGTGFYTVAASGMAPACKIYAVELQNDFLVTIRNKVKEAQLKNVECLLGNVERLHGTHLKDGIADKAIASNILSQVELREKFLQEVKRILKQGGEVMLVDWSPASQIFQTKIAIPKEKAKELFHEAGFIFTRDIDAGAHHYGMIFRKL